ncbi:MAG: sulfatase/phosphatase domain-containing protein, partial [Pseudomonadota bacterium]
SDALAALIDVGPTLLDAADASPLPEVSGRSLLPTLSGGPSGRECLFSEIQKQSRKAEAPTFRSVRNQRYRLTLETSTDTPCELFDLQEDPHEQDNRLGDPALAVQQAELTAQLRECMGQA